MPESAQTSPPPPVADPWLTAWPDSAEHAPLASDRLIRALEAHASAEAQDLVDCEAFAEHSEDPVARLLMDMVISDERRHHALLQSMVRRLRDEPSLAQANQPSNGDYEGCQALRALIRDEHEGARHLRHIARQESHVYGNLFSLLLETIARDSEKHATILRFLLTRLERRAP